MGLFDALQYYPAAAIAAALIFGLLVGSFLNVVIYRLPEMMKRDWKQQCIDFCLEEKLVEKSAFKKEDLAKQATFNLATPRSRCPKCGNLITALQNIPVLSYLALKGKCAGCKTPISARYPIIELITGLLSAYAVYHFGMSFEALGAIFLTWCLISLTMIDADTYLLPDSITLPLLWLGLLINYFSLYTDFSSAFFGAVFGYMSLWSVFQLFKLVTGKEGMGFGDFKLLGALGAWMGWQHLVTIIILSSVVGLVVSVIGIIFAGKDKAKPIPFGPYLATAGLLAFYFGDSIKIIYLGFF